MRYIAFLLLVSFTTSCTSIHYIDKSHWTDLDGYRDPPTKKSKKKTNNTVRDKHNHRIKVDRSKIVVVKMKRKKQSPLVIKKESRKEIETRYRAIDFTKKDFIGFPVTGSKIVVPRNRIDKFGVRRFDAIKTLGLIAVITLSVLVIGGAIVVASGADTGDGDDD